MNSIFYTLRSEKEHYDAQIILNAVRDVANLGYHLVTSDEQSTTFKAWWAQLHPEQAAKIQQEKGNTALDTSSIFTAGLSTQMQIEAEQFSTHQRGSLTIHAYSVALTGPMKGFEFTMRLKPQEEVASTTFDEGFFLKTDRQAAVASFEQWLGITQLIYDFLHPIYAYAFNHNGIIPPTSLEEVEAFKPHWLYEINLFGPEMVETLGGREFVLAAPAQIVRSLEDGGVLIIPEMNMYPEVLQYDWETVADYLGLEAPDL
jgi:hypothetical protein